MSERVSYYEGKTNSDQAPKPGRSGKPLQPLFVAAVLIVGIFLGSQLGKDTQIFDFGTPQGGDSGKLVELIDRIENNYVDTVERSALVDKAITAVLEDLDPHSYYISPNEFAGMQEQMQGGFEGIGVEFMIEDDTLIVVAPLAGGPSELAGILPGDRIVAVNDSSITGPDINNSEVMARLKGKHGTKVKLGIARSGESEVLDFELKRDLIPIYSVVADYMADDAIGYVKLDKFASNTYQEFCKAVDGLRAAGAKGLVIDLRNNGGGYLQSATNIIEEFLEKNELIVFTEGRSQGKRNTYSSKRGTYRDMEVVVLVNQRSASASEILAGALQDHDRSLIVGRRSFGKGLVQHQYELSDASAFRLTIARYYTPSGRCIQKPYGDGIEYGDDALDRYENGELLSADSISVVDSLRYETPLGRVVYGGGGITPDVFMPIDTIRSDYASRLAFEGVYRSFALEVANRDRAATGDKFPTMGSFDQGFEVSDELFNELTAAGEAREIETPTLSAEDRAEVALRLKAYLAKQYFNQNAYYYVLRNDDPEFHKAIEVLGNYTKYFKETLPEAQ